MKRFFALIFVFVLIFSTATISASATDLSKNVIDLGDGFYLQEVTVQRFYSRAGDTAVGHTSGNVYYGSTHIGNATLWGIFDISGSTAKALDSSISGTGYNGGSYTNGTSNCSRNTVSGTAYFSYNGFEKTARLSISCSPDGTLY